jgi:tetratricopeptide (TPR) repeat protein
LPSSCSAVCFWQSQPVRSRGSPCFPIRSTAAEHNDLGVAYEASGEWDRALAAYAAASRKDRDWDQPLINQGNVQAAMGDWMEAAASYRRALRRNPDNPEAMNNLAYALLQSERYPPGR